MKSFLLAMLLGVGLATAASVAAVRILLPEQVADSRAPSTSTRDEFSPNDAVEIVAARLGSSPKAERLRHSLRLGSKVEYHSPNHWTVRFNDASWTAHGTGLASQAETNARSGRYAEPDNEAARTFEREATGP